MGDLFARFRGAGSAIYVPNPTWGNHIPIFKNAGLEVKKYRYFNPETVGLDFEGDTPLLIQVIVLHHA